MSTAINFIGLVVGLAVGLVVGSFVGVVVGSFNGLSVGIGIPSVAN
ncbi:hypothetical protein SC206_09770 [Rouxiella sp. T17]